MKNKYKEIIDTLLDKDKIHTVGQPKSDWRVKVYPKPRLWINNETLKNNKKWLKELKKNFK